MHVVELVPALGVGGAERIVAMLGKALAVEGARVTVVALGARTGSWIERDLADAGVDVEFLGKGPGFEPRVVAGLGAALRRLRPDVVHTHLHVLKYLLPVWAGVGRPRVVHTLHNLADKEATEADQRLQRAAFAAGVEPVAIGEAVAESMGPVYGLRPRFTVANGVEVEAFQRDAATRARLRSSLGLPEGAPAFVVVGRLNPQKNHALLLDAFAEDAVAATGARLLVVGDGELRPDVEARVDALGLADRVHLLGVRRDVPDLLAAADAFVLSSDYEGNPLVVMEALAAGRAVVATAVGCVPELVPPEAGVLLPAGDRAALSAALAQVAGDLDHTHQMGAAGVARARARFDAAVMARAYLGVFRATSRPAFGRRRR